METRERPVSSYKTEKGSIPFRLWRDGLDGTTRNAVNARVTRFSAGNFGDTEGVGGGVCESKLDHGPGYRIYYGVDGDCIILLCGGDKATQDADIKIAKRYWNEYKKRRENEKPNG